MASTEEAVRTERSSLQELGRRHLWMHFSRMGSYEDHEIPIITRGEGCYVYDEHGKRYLDGLSALFCVNIGHGRADVAQAGADQAKELGFYTNWTFAHPRAIELAARVADLAPGDLNRVFFTSGGSEAVESAIKLARQYHKLTGNPLKTKLIARDIAYHGTSLGALSATGITSLRQPFEPLTPGGCHVPNTNTFRLPHGLSAQDLADTVAQRIEFEGPDTVAAVIMEPVQNAGGCFTPPEGYFQRVREICDEYNVLLISDEVICAWGRLGEWFGAQRYDYLPDIITTAKGLTSSYAPMGAVIASDRVFEPFRHGDASFTHGFTFGGHPISSAVALANLDVMEREGILENVRAHEGDFRQMLESLRDIPIVGDVRGAGYFQRDRAGQGPGLRRAVDRRGVRDPAARLPLRRAVPPRADLPRRRPRRPGDPAVAAADRRAQAVRGDRGDPAPGPHRGGRPDARTLARSCSIRPGASSGPTGGVGRGVRDLVPPTRSEPMLTVRELLRDLDVRLLCGEAATDLPVRWVHISELKDPTPWLSGGELLLTTGMQLNTPSARASSSTGWPTTSWPAWASASASVTARFRRRSCRPPPSATSRCSRCPTRCRSSPSPRRPSRSWSTSSTRCCAGRCRRTSAWSAWCSPQRGLEALAGTLATLIGAAVLVFDARGEPLAQRAFRRAIEPEAVTALRDDESTSVGREPTRIAPSCPPTPGWRIARWRCR